MPNNAKKSSGVPNPLSIFPLPVTKYYLLVDKNTGSSVYYRYKKRYFYNDKKEVDSKDSVDGIVFNPLTAQFSKLVDTTTLDYLHEHAELLGENIFARVSAGVVFASISDALNLFN